MATKLAALAGVGSGCLILAIGRGEAPAWLRCLLVLFFGAGSLLYGYSAWVPSAPRWLSSPPVVGIACVWAGFAVMWVPSNVICSTALIGFGTRLLMIEHKKREVEEERGAGAVVEGHRERGGELAHRHASHAPAPRG